MWERTAKQTLHLPRNRQRLDPVWGDGTQACPSRFFANSTLKMFLTHLLMNRLGKSQYEQNMVNMPNAVFAPDIGARVLL